MPDARVKFIQFTPHFLKSFQKLPASVQKLAKEKDELFRENPFDARLHTHKLKGELSGTWSYSVNPATRETPAAGGRAGESPSSTLPN